MARTGSDLPAQLELPTADACFRVPIKRRAEGDELRVIRVAEQALRRLVKPLRDMIERVWRTIFRVAEFFCDRASLKISIKPKESLFAYLRGRRGTVG